MEKRVYLALLLLMACHVCSAQNLVPNGSFEIQTSCPNAQNQVYKAMPWMNPSTGTPIGTTGTPDYFSQCSTTGFGVPQNVCGNQLARTGDSYVGIHLWSTAPNPDSVREYIEVPLTSALIAGNCYHFEMYFSHADYYRYTSDNFGVYFSDTAVTGVPNFFPLPFTPQIQNMIANFPDTTTWKLMSGDYLSEGGESYLIIGNFKDDAHTNAWMMSPSQPVVGAYLFIDDVSLVPMTPCNVTGMDAELVDAIEVYPNPFSQSLQISTPVDTPSEVSLYDLTGREVLRQAFIHAVSLDVDALPRGVYLYEVRCGAGVVGKQGKLVSR